jgi:hypothetical protein
MVTGPTVADWRDQEAANETVFREMNEWTEEDSDGRDGLKRPMDIYLCECSDLRCSAPIRLTRTEYEGIREDATRFALALNHENPEIDTVIAENDRFATIEKSFGEASRIARASNPRR